MFYLCLNLDIRTSLREVLEAGLGELFTIAQVDAGEVGAALREVMEAGVGDLPAIAQVDAGEVRAAL